MYKYHVNRSASHILADIADGLDAFADVTLPIKIQQFTKRHLNPEQISVSPEAAKIWIDLFLKSLQNDAGKQLKIAMEGLDQARTELVNPIPSHLPEMDKTALMLARLRAEPIVTSPGFVGRSVLWPDGSYDGYVRPIDCKTNVNKAAKSNPVSRTPISFQPTCVRMATK